MLATCRRGHLLVPENIYEYKGKRECRACRKLASDRYYVKVHGEDARPGPTGGRPRLFDYELCLDMFNDGANRGELARFFGVSRQSIMRVTNPDYRERMVKECRERRQARARVSA